MYVNLFHLLTELSVVTLITSSPQTNNVILEHSYTIANQHKQQHLLCRPENIIPTHINNILLPCIVYAVNFWLFKTFRRSDLILIV